MAEKIEILDDSSINFDLTNKEAEERLKKEEKAEEKKKSGKKP
jgi:hypothetical protein